jgi:hypothetical protein
MHKVVKKLWLPNGAAVLVGTAAGPSGGGEPVILYSASPALDGSDNNPGTSFRVVVPITDNALTQIRATFVPGAPNSLAILHASIGKWDAGEPSLSNTTTTPIELLFGGLSGFSATASPQTSDWSDFSGLSLTTGDKIVISIDIASSGYIMKNSSSTGVTTFYKGGESYDVADTTGLGFNPMASTNYGIDSVETR